VYAKEGAQKEGSSKLARREKETGNGRFPSQRGKKETQVGESNEERQHGTAGGGVGEKFQPERTQKWTIPVATI